MLPGFSSKNDQIGGGKTDRRLLVSKPGHQIVKSNCLEEFHHLCHQENENVLALLNQPPQLVQL